MGNYSIGLDIGNASVGWAVINDNYELHKYKKKNMWGVRLFEQAETASKRRLHRTTARRLHRRRERIRLLQELLEPLIIEKDPTFFIRLDESFLWQEDRTYKNKFNLFIDKDYTDSDYYKQFKTIYHLRKYLIETKEKVDPRLIYLALHHTIKYRGHFIYEGQNFQLTDNSNLNQLIKDIFDSCYECEILKNTYTLDKLEEVGSILKDKMLNRTQKIEKVLSGLNVNKKSEESHLLQLILGMKCDLNALFKSSLLLDDKGKGIKYSISDDKFEEYVPLIEEVLGNYNQIITNIQNCYSLLMLHEVVGEATTLSSAMVEKYNKYGADLADLKNVLKKYNCIESYERIFKDRGDISYHAYLNQRGKVINNKDSQNRFYSLVKKELESNSELAKDTITIRILKEITEKKFLIFLNTKVNSTIPYQLHLKELELILENQSIFYEDLKRDMHKIKSLLTFKIPYYVGPLNSNSSFAWIQKKSEEKIRPWNFSDVVDESKSAEVFINRMTNYCTYLRDEPVLPAQSILYSRFKLLNELNKVRINGHLISTDVKNYMINELFLKNKSVTKKQFISAYQSYCGSSKDIVIEGLQEENKFASSLKSEQDFIKILGKIDHQNLKMIETIIYWLTVFNEEKMVIQKIKDKFSGILTDLQIQRIAKLKYTGWGRLSRKLLNDIKIIAPNQEKLSLMDCLSQTNLNFMQLMNSEHYDFKTKIEELYPKVKKEKITLKDIETMYGSPAIKRGVWQSVQIIQEIEKVMGCKPKNIFLEFARSDEESRRKKSRYKQLEKIFSDNSIEDEKKLLRELKVVENDKNLNKIKYYLYFVQLGKCMYTKESLDIEMLSTYQVDHIIPQSLIKDDSFENLVLVKSSRNQDKLDYKMPLDVVSDANVMKCWWEYLYQLNLITKKKYFNLMTKTFSEEQIHSFINRQLVETRQVSKEVANLLEQVYENRVVTVKAKLVHDLREQFKLPKCREINDYHHAHDAYLTSVLGSYILKRYPKLEKEFIYSEYLKLNRKEQKSKNKFGFIISSMNRTSLVETTGEVIWSDKEHPALLRKTFNYKDCFITKRLDENTEFYKITLNPKKDGNLRPIKKGMDVKKYGGYEGVQEAYFMVIEYDSGKKKNPRIKKLIGIPVYIASLEKNNPSCINQYLLEQGYLNAKILIRKLMKNQLVETNGNLIYLTSSKEWNNAKQLIVDQETYKQLSIIFYLLDNNQLSLKDDEAADKLNDIYDLLIKKMKTHYVIFSNIANKLLNQKDKFKSLSYDEKVKALKNIVIIMQANPSNGNLKLIGLTDREGRLSKKNLDVEQSTFIQQSITGLFEKRIRV